MDRNGYIRNVAIRMDEKFYKYLEDCNLLMFFVVVLDPRFKMKFINFCFPPIYQEDEAKMHIEGVLTALSEYYEFYLATHNMTIMQQANEDAIVVAFSNVFGRDVGPKALMTIFINYPLYVGFFSSSQYGTRVLETPFLKFLTFSSGLRHAVLQYHMT
jgi:hypothetical protein